MELTEEFSSIASPYSPHSPNSNNNNNNNYPRSIIHNNNNNHNNNNQEDSQAHLRPVSAAAQATAFERAAMEFGDGYRRILQTIGEPGYHAMKSLFYGDEGPPAGTIPSITVPFELFEAVQNRFATTKASLEQTKLDLHTRHQEYAVLQEQHEQLQASYNLLEKRAGELEKKNTQLHQNIAKQDVTAEQLRQQVTRMKSEMEMIEDKMAKRDEELQATHHRVAEGLVLLSQKETIIANLRRQLGRGGRIKSNSISGKIDGEGEEYSAEMLKRIADDVEGRSIEAQLRLYVVELETKIKSVKDEKEYIMLRHSLYRKHVQDVTEAYETLCMSKEDAVALHVCELPPAPTQNSLLPLNHEKSHTNSIVSTGQDESKLTDTERNSRKVSEILMNMNPNEFKNVIEPNAPRHNSEISRSTTRSTSGEFQSFVQENIKDETPLIDSVESKRPSKSTKDEEKRSSYDSGKRNNRMSGGSSGHKETGKTRSPYLSRSTSRSRELSSKSSKLATDKDIVEPLSVKTPSSTSPGSPKTNTLNTGFITTKSSPNTPMISQGSTLIQSTGSSPKPQQSSSISQNVSTPSASKANNKSTHRTSTSPHGDDEKNNNKNKVTKEQGVQTDFRAGKVSRGVSRPNSSSLGRVPRNSHRISRISGFTSDIDAFSAQTPLNTNNIEGEEGEVLTTTIPGEVNISEVSQSKPRVSASIAQRTSNTIFKESPVSGSISVVLPTFGEGDNEAEIEEGREHFSFSGNQMNAGSERNNEKRNETSTRTRSATNRRVRALAREYKELHDLLTELDEILLSVNEKARTESTKSVAFYADEHDEDAATQVDYMRNIVESDVKLIGRILRLLQKKSSGRINSNIKSSMMTSSLSGLASGTEGVGVGELVKEQGLEEKKLGNFKFGRTPATGISVPPGGEIDVINNEFAEPIPNVSKRVTQHEVGNVREASVSWSSEVDDITNPIEDKIDHNDNNNNNNNNSDFLIDNTNSHRKSSHEDSIKTPLNKLEPYTKDEMEKKKSISDKHNLTTEEIVNNNESTNKEVNKEQHIIEKQKNSLTNKHNLHESTGKRSPHTPLQKRKQNPRPTSSSRSPPISKGSRVNEKRDKELQGHKQTNKEISNITSSINNNDNNNNNNNNATTSATTDLPNVHINKNNNNNNNNNNNKVATDPTGKSTENNNSEIIPTLPSLGVAARHTLYRNASRMRKIPQRTPWIPAMIRLDLGDHINSNEKQEKQQLQIQKLQTQQQQQYTFARPHPHLTNMQGTVLPWAGFFHRTLYSSGIPTEKTAPVNINTEGKTNNNNTNNNKEDNNDTNTNNDNNSNSVPIIPLFPSSSALAKVQSMPFNTLTPTNTSKERKYNDLALDGKTVPTSFLNSTGASRVALTPARPTTSQKQQKTISHALFIPKVLNFPMPDPSYDYNNNYHSNSSLSDFTLSGHGLGETTNYTCQPVQSPTNYKENTSFKQFPITTITTIGNNNYNNNSYATSEEVIARILRRSPVLYRHGRINSARPQQHYYYYYTNNYTSRIITRKRQEAQYRRRRSFPQTFYPYSLNNNYNYHNNIMSNRPHWTPLYKYNSNPQVREAAVMNFCIGQRRNSEVNNLRMRYLHRFAKRNPRRASLVKKWISAKVQTSEPVRYEIFPMIVESKGGWCPPKIRKE